MTIDAPTTPPTCSWSKEAADIFAQHGLRCTRQRVMVFRALAARKDHPTADMLFRSLQDREQNISLATVYNTLEAFVDAGLTRKLPPSAGQISSRYDADTDPHLHLRDINSSKVADVPEDLSRRIVDALPKKLINELSERCGFHVDDISIEFTGRFNGS